LKGGARKGAPFFFAESPALFRLALEIKPFTPYESGWKFPTRIFANRTILFLRGERGCYALSDFTHRARRRGDKPRQSREVVMVKETDIFSINDL
jgi:hypothetical protein